MNTTVNVRRVVALAAAALTLTTQASMTGFQTPATRGTPGSSYDGWEVFKTAVGSPGNLGDAAGSSGRGHLTQNDANAFLTGSGNIYNQTGKSDFTLTFINPAAVDHVLFQVRTAGTELDYSSVQLSYAGGTLSGTRTETDRTPFGGPPGTPGSGFAVSSAYEFSLAGLGVNSFQIGFKAADASLSLDSVALDVSSVPEPGTWALLAGGVAVLAVGCWRRR